MLGAWEEAKSLHTVLVDIAKQMGERMASAEKEGIMGGTTYWACTNHAEECPRLLGGLRPAHARAFCSISHTRREVIVILSVGPKLVNSLCKYMK